VRRRTNIWSAENAGWKADLAPSPVILIPQSREKDLSQDARSLTLSKRDPSFEREVPLPRPRDRDDSV